MSWFIHMCYDYTMTNKQKRVIDLLPEIVASGGTTADAMRQAGYSESMARNPQKLKAMPEVQNELQRLLELKGITLDKALQPIADGLTATKMVVHGKNSEESWIDMIPDNPVRLQASDRALKLLNITKDNPQPPNLQDLTDAINDNIDEVALTTLVFRKDDVQSMSIE